MNGLEITAVALAVVTWPVTQFAVMIVTILLPGMAAARARAKRRRRAATREDT